MMLIHIILSLIVVALFLIAATQALLLAVQDYMLRTHQMGSLIKGIPPVETMEKILFRMLGVGFICFSIFLIFSICFIPITTPILMQHVLVALFAWIVFGVLLLGRKLYGWRGQIAIRWTLSGFGLLLLSYLGLRMLLY